ncbi:hypothetical protein D6D05_00265 [Aureobasidium pullulans]|nr:hypothetical protein D6D05_00265 [Aureobasidium pullulans]
MWFPSLVQILYLLFIGAQLYGLFLHFLSPSTGLVNNTRSLQIKGLSFLAFLISFPSIFATSLPTAVSHSTNTGLLHLLSWVFLAGSLTLYYWCLEITGQGHLSVIFGKVTPKEVINTGPEGADLEERQFMLNEDVVKGETVELGVRRKYESYKSVVGARWIPGII